MENVNIILKKWRDTAGLNTYKELANFLDVSPNTLDVWKNRNNIPEKQINKYKKLIKESKKSNTISIPKLKIEASCGSGANLECIDSFETEGELIIDADTLKVTNGNLKALHVEGFSMVPVLFPDSWVIFNEHGTYQGEGLYVLNFRNILMVKLLQINSEGKLRIISTNKDYESYTIDLEDQSIFKVIGKVVRTIM